MAGLNSNLIRFGVFEADRATGELRMPGRSIRLQEQPFRILLLLLEHQGEVVSRDELQARIWGGKPMSTSKKDLTLRFGNSAMPGRLGGESSLHRDLAPQGLPVYRDRGSSWRDANPSGAKNLPG